MNVKWTQQEVAILIDNYNKISNEKLCDLFPNKSHMGIYKKAYKLGLRKSKEIEFKNRSEARKREKGANWNGGIKITSKGYRQILMPEHKRADSNGYVMEHIIVWENASGIPVPKSCCVHHINGNKSDNRIENLCLMTHGAHTTMHSTGRKHTEETKQKIRERRKNYVKQNRYHGENHEKS